MPTGSQKNQFDRLNKEDIKEDIEGALKCLVAC